MKKLILALVLTSATAVPALANTVGAKETVLGTVILTDEATNLTVTQSDVCKGAQKAVLTNPGKDPVYGCWAQKADFWSGKPQVRVYWAMKTGLEEGIYKPDSFR